MSPDVARRILTIIAAAFAAEDGVCHGDPGQGAYLAEALGKIQAIVEECQ